MENAALIIVDVQQAFEDEKWGERNNLNAEENIKKLLNTWRMECLPVIHIQHSSENLSSLFHPSKKSFEIKEIVKPYENELIITKKVNSGFIGTNLEVYLKNNNISTVVIVGLTTPHCVSTTTRMSGNLGFDTYLVSDATAAFAMKDHHGNQYDPKTIHNITIATLHDEFATILTTEQLMKIIEKA
ncbi:cysteine hydrolase family protein [Aquibacillus rhizosphaerae]|uniref:Cysteine hydrolase family protein n=1 Tax=Aquibacillus rhizosphaerae TaxID=3051431 RepID=A0ABT7LB24_9BACI|nr:cysteine hydrolase family protein [Aquibacillus sp. LR5S19]MDL4843063.1 cysteine hydrolase family protein [Aquibacillus sp. LR5S19]